MKPKMGRSECYIVILINGITTNRTFPNRAHLTSHDLIDLQTNVQRLKEIYPDKIIRFAEVRHLSFDHLDAMVKFNKEKS